MKDEFPDQPADDETPDAVDTEESSEVSDADDPVTAIARERDEVYDRLLRKTAEFDNYRKRVERERRAQADQSVTDLLLDILLVVDDFDLAIGTVTDTAPAAYRKGIELIASKLHELLKKHGVKPIEAVGKDFDPELHQAVTYDETPGHRDGEVVSELRRGYMMGDRLLRPAMVKVAKA